MNRRLCSFRKIVFGRYFWKMFHLTSSLLTFWFFSIYRAYKINISPNILGASCSNFYVFALKLGIYNESRYSIGMQEKGKSKKIFSFAYFIQNFLLKRKLWPSPYQNRYLIFIQHNHGGIFSHYFCKKPYLRCSTWFWMELCMNY